MEESTGSSVDYLRLVRRVVVHRWRIILAALLSVVVPTIAFVILSTENLYEASATLFILPESSDSMFLRDFTSPETGGLYLVLLKSRSLAEAIIEALPKESRDELTRRVLLRDYLLTFMNSVRRLIGSEVVVYRPSEVALRELQEARMSFAVGRDGTITITAIAFSPRVAVDLANTYVEVLLSKSSAFARQQARGTRELIENLLTQARTNQTEADDALRKYQAGIGGSLKLPEESRLELTSLANLESQINEIQVSREIAENRLAYLKGDKTRGTMGADPVLLATRDRLSQLEAKLAALTEKYTDQHPSVQNVRAEIEEAQQRLAASRQPLQRPKPGGAQVQLGSVETGQLSKQMAALEAEIVTLQARETTVQQRASRLRKSLSAMSAHEQEYSALLRGVMTQTKLTDTLMDKLTAARLSERSQVRSIHVIDQANLPRQPSPRQPMKLLLLGLVGGLGLGVGAATLREQMARVVETERDVTSVTGLSVLGAIPIAERPRHATDPRRPSNLPILFIENGYHSLPADACRAIRTTIECQSLERPLRTLLITSPGAHEGKSTVLLNLARAFLEADRRLFIIDADLRRPVIHQALERPNSIGLADVLERRTSWAEAYQELAPSLDFIPAGARPLNPSSLLASRLMTRVLQQARQRADIVLIDAAPVLAVADCLPLCRQVDGVVLVSRFGATRRGSLQRARDQLHKVGANVVGVVLNGLSRRETRHYYAEYNDYAVLAKHTSKGSLRQ